MESFPPEIPESQLDDTSTQAPATEPRLLTRRGDAATDDGNMAQETQGKRHVRQHIVHHGRSLTALSERLRRTPRRTPDSAPTQQTRRRAIRRFARWFPALVLVLGVLLIATLITFALFLRHDMTAALPQVDGELHLAGLSAPVTVTRDKLGVPTIGAASLNDLLFAQGFVTAQDRLWQMDALRRHGAGELAEILGPSLLAHDKTQRVLQLRSAADRAVLLLPPGQLAQLQAYARGVNAFMEQEGDSLPVEFHLLHYRPAPWTPRDTLLVSLVMFQDLATSYPRKLEREAFSHHLPPELLADLYPGSSFRDMPPTQPRPDLTTPKQEIEQIPLDRSQVKLHEPAATQAPALPQSGSIFARCPECRSGSNNWAVSGAHTQSGQPMVSNDMHLSLSVPDIWYEATLHTAGSATDPKLDVSGFTLPGTPFVIVGRNAHVAWTVTNLGGDVQDIHVEHLRRDGDHTESQQPDGSWSPVAHHRELIRVRGGRDRTMDVLTTQTHIGDAVVDTPVITPLIPGEQRTLSLLWTAYDPHNLSVPLGDVNGAATGAALVAAFASFGGPSLNLVYADDAGHIGYHALGRIPVRGPADRHPRAQPAQVLPENGSPIPDESPEGEAGDDDAPQAQLNVGPHLLTVAFHVRHARRALRGQPAPSRTAPHKQPVQPAAENDQPIPTPAPLLDYTVGSPIPTVPVDALDHSVQWSGYVPFNELPSVVNPADGVLATANARITADDYPYFLSNEWAPSYRTERIHKLLAGRTGLTAPDMLEIEMDSTSAFDRLFAERLAYALDHTADKALQKDKRLRIAADILRVWDGNMTPDSSAAAIVTAARPQLLALLLRAQIAQHDHLSPKDTSLDRIVSEYDWESATVALENLLTFRPARWLPNGYVSWNDLLATVVQRGLAGESAPHDLTRWKYSALHAIDIEHPVLSPSPLVRRMLGVRTGTGAQAIAGDGTTILATGRNFGPSERFTADLAAPEKTTANLTTGQSGNPRSPHYLDQFSAWLRGETFSLPLQGAAAEHTLRLLP